VWRMLIPIYGETLEHEHNDITTTFPLTVEFAPSAGRSSCRRGSERVPSTASMASSEGVSSRPMKNACQLGSLCRRRAARSEVYMRSGDSAKTAGTHHNGYGSENCAGGNHL
jgi:hypothetical protein